MFLGGRGLVLGEMMELCGPSGCGKSMLCHVLCVCMTVQHKDLEVVYVDTRNTFSVKTLTDVIMWMWNGIQGEKEDLHTFQKSVLSRVRHVAAYELSDTFASLRNIDRVYTTSRSKSLGVLIVDSVTALLSSLIGGVKTGIGFAAMSEFGTSLKMLARKHNASVIVTNGTVTANIDTESSLSSSSLRKPALGRTWESVPSVRVWMESDHHHHSSDNDGVHSGNNTTLTKFRTCMRTLKSPRISTTAQQPFVFEIDF